MASRSDRSPLLRRIQRWFRALRPGKAAADPKKKRPETPKNIYPLY